MSENRELVERAVQPLIKLTERLEKLRERAIRVRDKGMYVMPSTYVMGVIDALDLILTGSSEVSERLSGMEKILKID